MKEVIYTTLFLSAEACHVGESSIFRFCNTRDLPGYQEFKIALAHSTSLKDEMPQLSNKVTMDDSIDELSQKILTSNVNALTETHNLINEKDVSLAVDMIIEANRVQFFGVGASLRSEEH